MASWPAILPQYPRNGTFKETRSNSNRAFQPDMGRPIFSGEVSLSYELWEGEYLIREDLLSDFWTFWDTTLTKGVGEFQMLHPRTGLMVTVEFQNPTEPPSVNQSTKGVHSVTLSLRKVS